MIDRHTRRMRTPKSFAGFTMIEVLVTLVVIALGLIGVIGLQARGQQAELESYQRGQALVLLQDMVDKMNTNRNDTFAGNYVTASPVGGGGALTNCAALTGYRYDLCDWGNQLNGAAEVGTVGTCDTSAGTACVGAMLGARGCISYGGAATELTTSDGTNEPGTGIYTISVVWQGIAPTNNPPANLTCGQNLYPSETMRRVVTATLRIADLVSK